jgi:hypothetical protein
VSADTSLQTKSRFRSGFFIYRNFFLQFKYKKQRSRRKHCKQRDQFLFWWRYGRATTRPSETLHYPDLVARVSQSAPHGAKQQEEEHNLHFQC